MALSGHGGVEEWLNADMALNKFLVLEGYHITACIVPNAFGFSQVSRRNVLKSN